MDPRLKSPPHLTAPWCTHTLRKGVDTILPLQEKLGRGEYNKATTKVLHFKRNPEAIAVEALEQKRCSTLEAENAALKGQLQKLEQQSPSAAGAHAEAGSVDSAVKEAQISVLQRQVTAKCPPQMFKCHLTCAYAVPSDAMAAA